MIKDIIENPSYKELIEKQEFEKNIVDAQREVLIESFKAVFGYKYNYEHHLIYIYLYMPQISPIHI